MEDVELESYRLVAQDTISIKLEDKDSEIEPIPVKTDVGIPVPELDTLSNILASFHEMLIMFPKSFWILLIGCNGQVTSITCN